MLSLKKPRSEAADGPVNNKFVLCSMNIIIGMALIAMCLNLMQEKFITAALGKTKILHLIPNHIL